MTVVLKTSDDAVLGQELAQVRIDANCAPAEAMERALRLWAPRARIRSVRLSGGAPDSLQCPLMSARIYAIPRDRSGDLVLAILANDKAGMSVSATVGVNVPVTTAAA